jgi:hypothetical protein
LIAALSIINVAAQREQLITKHNVLQASYTNYLGVDEVAKELILYTTSKDAIAPLKKQCIGFRNTTILLMLDHLRQKTAIWMTTAQKQEYKTSGHNTQWDPKLSITAYSYTLIASRLTGQLRLCNKQSQDPFGGKPPEARQPLLWTDRPMTDQQMTNQSQRN